MLLCFFSRFPFTKTYKYANKQQLPQGTDVSTQLITTAGAGDNTWTEVDPQSVQALTVFCEASPKHKRRVATRLYAFTVWIILFVIGTLGYYFVECDREFPFSVIIAMSIVYAAVTIFGIMIYLSTFGEPSEEVFPLLKTMLCKLFYTFDDNNDIPSAVHNIRCADAVIGYNCGLRIKELKWLVLCYFLSLFFIRAFVLTVGVIWTVGFTHFKCVWLAIIMTINCDFFMVFLSVSYWYRNRLYMEVIAKYFNVEWVNVVGHDSWAPFVGYPLVSAPNLTEFRMGLLTEGLFVQVLKYNRYSWLISWYFSILASVHTVVASIWFIRDVLYGTLSKRYWLLYVASNGFVFLIATLVCCWGLESLLNNFFVRTVDRNDGLSFFKAYTTKLVEEVTFVGISLKNAKRVCLSFCGSYFLATVTGFVLASYADLIVFHLLGYGRKNIFFPQQNH